MRNNPSKEIPRKEGFFFEMNHALCMALIAIGANNPHYVTKYLRRFKALVKPSGIFNEITPADKAIYGDKEKMIKYGVISRCDRIIENMEEAKSGGKIDLKNVLTDISGIISLTNRYYMYAKTKVFFTGSYKPAFDIYEKEGIE